MGIYISDLEISKDKAVQDEDDGFDELIKLSDIDYMHTPSVEEIIKGDGE